MKVHEVKCWPDFFQPLFDGSKPFEIRFDDRHYAVDDVLHVREWDDRRGAYTGREVRKLITYKLEGVGAGSIAPLQDLVRGFCALGLTDEV